MAVDFWKSINTRGRKSSRKLYEYSRILTSKRHYKPYRKLFSHYEIAGFSNKPFQLGYDNNPGNFLDEFF